MSEQPATGTLPVTELLVRWSEGDAAALSELMPFVYSELRRLAERAARGERSGHTLQPTALIHEAYLRLAKGETPAWRDRIHFFAVSARLMRRILVDHARALRANRRGGGAIKLSLQELEEKPGKMPAASTGAELGDFLVLDEALSALAEVDARKAQVIEVRFFAGLSVAETAELLGVSKPTVILDTRLARAWLFERIFGEELPQE